MVLFKHGDRSAAYAVDPDLNIRPITAAQFVAAAECEPNTPYAPLPDNTNQRVMTALSKSREDAASRLGRYRRPGANTRLRRHLSRQLRLLREQFREDQEELRRVGILQQIFLDHLPPNIVSELEEVRRMDITGPALIRRLEAMRDRHRLNPPDPDEDQALPAEADVVRIICSDAIVEA